MKLLRGATAAVLPAIVLALAGIVTAVPAQAQQNADGTVQSDTLPVILLTLTVAGLAMLVLSLGYLYRRTRGEQDELIPKEVPPFGVPGGHAEQHDHDETHPELDVHGRADTSAEARTVPAAPATTAGDGELQDAGTRH